MNYDPLISDKNMSSLKIKKSNMNDLENRLTNLDQKLNDYKRK